VPRPLTRSLSAVRKDLRDLIQPVGLLVFALAASAVAWRFRLLDRLPELQSWIDGFGAVGPLVFLGLSIVGITIAVPAVLFNMASGALFGLGWGSCVALVGGLVGAAFAFLLARYAARDSFKRWMSRHQWMRLMEERADRYDALLVVATRVLPIFPFNLVNYAWGLTRITFARYLIWTAVGKTPNFVFWVAFGASSVEGATTGRIPPRLSWTLAILAIVMAAISVWTRSRMRARSAAQTNAELEREEMTRGPLD
jgi:uncharacterized membrane protein YdjX (TVP38/TMEM64 family)